jgi:hypothetical protein
MPGNPLEREGAKSCGTKVPGDREGIYTIPFRNPPEGDFFWVCQTHIRRKKWIFQRKPYRSDYSGIPEPVR